MWQEYFKVVGIVPGEVVVPGYGKIDFSCSGLSVDMCQELYESDFPYLQLTDAGKSFLYNIPIDTAPPPTDKTIKYSHNKKGLSR